MPTNAFFPANGAGRECFVQEGWTSGLPSFEAFMKSGVLEKDHAFKVPTTSPASPR
jgi:hypothetical protein